MNSQYKIRNPILKVIWAGWESDTFTLQNNGWQVSVHENPFDRGYHSIRIAIHHPEFKMYGMSQSVIIDRMYFGDSSNIDLYKAMPPIPIQQMSSELFVRCFENIDFRKFSPINAEPSWTDVREKSIKDFNIFQPIKKAEHQIVIPTYSQGELLEQILKLQDPKQKEIREKKRREIRDFMREENQNVKLQEDVFAEILVS